MSPGRIDAATLRGRLGDGREIALIDVRDGGPFARCHLLTASSVPLAQIELRAPMLIPRRDVRVVAMDGDGGRGGEAERAAALLERHGWTDVSVLDGGLEGWRAAGHEVFSGTNVPSKAFGEHVEHAFDTPRIEPGELERWRAEGRDVVVFDSRPLEEYRQVSIPGAADCPGAELVLRVPAQLRSPDTIVVVNCAGRTRSILGAQSLRNAGLPNPVYALKNGTMGWHLAGLRTDRGRENLVDEPSGDGLARARALAVGVARRWAVRFVDVATLERMRAERHRTTYVFDVRLPDAFAAGHLPGSLNAPGGQLVQATDTFAAVRHARIVLVDRHAVQAPMTAHWLAQMGWTDVHVLLGGLDGALETGPVRVPALGADRIAAAAIDVAGLAAALPRGGVRIVDVGDSYWYRNGRIPGSCYAMRSRLADALAALPLEAPLVFCCNDGRLAPHAAQDAIALGRTDVRWLDGGRAAWRAAGQPVEACPGDDDPLLLTATDDMWYPPWAHKDDVEAAMRQYLTWEVDLLKQLEREPYLRFGTPAPEQAPGAAPA
ncbi:MAG: rhodanese-like domain-containing protein [Burkholderiales bacterium]|jgi:rhodanese-related sulfurtransferase